MFKSLGIKNGYRDLAFKINDTSFKSFDLSEDNKNFRKGIDLFPQI